MIHFRPWIRLTALSQIPEAIIKHYSQGQDEHVDYVIVRAVRSSDIRLDIRLDGSTVSRDIVILDFEDGKTHFWERNPLNGSEWKLKRYYRYLELI